MTQKRIWTRCLTVWFITDKHIVRATVHTNFSWREWSCRRLGTGQSRVSGLTEMRHCVWDRERAGCRESLFCYTPSSLLPTTMCYYYYVTTMCYTTPTGLQDTILVSPTLSMIQVHTRTLVYKFIQEHWFSQTGDLHCYFDNQVL